MCNTFQISPPLGWVNWDKLLSSSLSSSFFFFFFLSLERWGYTIKRSCSGRWGAGRCHTPISFHSLLPSPLSSPAIIISLLWSKTASQTQMAICYFLMNTNMEGMIRRILTVTNFKCIVSCYQWVAVNVDSVLAFIFWGVRRGKHANLSSPLSIWCRHTIKTVLILVPDSRLCFFFFFFWGDFVKCIMDWGLSQTHCILNINECNC